VPGGAAMNCAVAYAHVGPPPVKAAVMMPLPVADGAV
jgi:hypothetical protein